MLNIDDFTKRLEILLEHYGLSASVFADKLGVQRSGLSHLMSGRNRPSLDFVMKITDNFPEVDLYWLLNGKGDFPKTEGYTHYKAATQKQSSVLDTHPKNEKVKDIQDLFSGSTQTPQQTLPPGVPMPESRIELPADAPEEIERIVVFYKNGRFKNYNP